MCTGQTLFSLRIEPDILRIRPWNELLATGAQATWLLMFTFFVDVTLLYILIAIISINCVLITTLIIVILPTRMNYFLVNCLICLQDVFDEIKKKIYWACLKYCDTPSFNQY